MTQQTYKFKKGERIALDCVYDVLSVIPHDCYSQDDPFDDKPFDSTVENDGGESILFLKNVTLKIDLRVT